MKIKRYTVKLNSLPKIEELLQELYNECCKNIEETQNQINKLANSVQLNNEELMDSKTKYAKAMNDYITTKDKAIGRKLEIAKLMQEIYKFNGNVSAVQQESNMSYDWDELKDTLVENPATTTAADTDRIVREYNITKK